MAIITNHIDFNPNASPSYMRSPEHFKNYCRVFYSRQLDIFGYPFNPVGFAPSPCSPSGKSVGQGGTI